jgi:Zinc carboxypeptidase
MTMVAQRSLLALLVGTGPGVAAQALPQTTAERTGYAATSTNVQVGAFLDSLTLAGAPLVVSELGTTALGKPIYFVIAADPPITSPAEAAADRLVVYLQANIHGGEVEGKEAVLALLRELAGARRHLLQRLVILVAPDYNPDGNDALGPQAANRSEQNGPALVGQRADGLNLDLNRDYFKAEAPETRASLARIYATWDPALMVDLHTTDGTRHGYQLTYAPPLDPNGPPGPAAFVRDEMLPALRKTLQDTYHEPIFDYGNVDTPLAPKSWDSYAPLGWFGTNYVGLRGRLAILSEAYSHADFRTRVRVTHDFLVAILEYAALHADEIHRLEREADRQTTLEGAGLAPRPNLAVAYRLARRGAGRPRSDEAEPRLRVRPPGAPRHGGAAHPPPPGPRSLRRLPHRAARAGLLPAGGGRPGRRAAPPARHQGRAAGSRLERHRRAAYPCPAQVGGP